MRATVATMDTTLDRSDVRARVYREILAPKIDSLESERNIRLCVGAGAFLFLLFLAALVGMAIALLLSALLGDWAVALGLCLGGSVIPFGWRFTFRRRRKETYIPRILDALGWHGASYSPKSRMRKSLIKFVVPHGWLDRIDGEDSVSERRPAGRYVFCEASRSKWKADAGGTWQRERIGHGWILHVLPTRPLPGWGVEGRLRLDPDGTVRAGEMEIPPAFWEPLRHVMRLAGVDEASAFPLADGIGFAFVTERDLFEDIGNINEEFHQAKALRLIEEIDSVAGAGARMLDLLESGL